MSAGVREVNPGKDDSKSVEVNVAVDGPVYLFKGRVTAAEAARGITEGNEGFELVATGTARGSMLVEGRYGSFTLYAPNGAEGFVRVT